MYKANKVIWKDGIFVYPQHFQQQDIYIENLLANQCIIQPDFHWGIYQLEIDEAFLKLNKIVIRKCIGVFPNGVFFSIPDRDEIDAIQIPSDYNDKLIYIGISVGNGSNLNKGENKKNRNERYYPEEIELPDINSITENGRLITIGKLNINLYLDKEYSDDIIVMPILRILDANKEISIDTSYIPPSLKVQSSKVLHGYANKILGLLNHYISSNNHLRGALSTNKQLNSVEGILILQTANSYKYLFSLLVNDKCLTPLMLLREMSSLFGALITFTRRFITEPIDLQYDHLDLSASFEPLIKWIALLFDELNEYVAVQIILQLKDKGVFTAISSHLPSLHTVDLIIGIEFNQIISVPEQTKIFNSIKISSISEIKRLISLQISGIEFYQLNVLPSYVPYNEKILYLKIKQDGTLWKVMSEHKDIAVYLSSKSNEVVSVKLWAIPKTIQ